MSTIFLSANDIFTLASTNTNDAVIGRPGGAETVILQGNPTGTLLDGNIEIVQVAGSASNTTLQVNSTSGRLELSSGGVVYATFAGGLNQAVDLQFTDGNVTLTQTGANSYSIANPTNLNDIATFNPTTSLSGSAVGRGNATSTAGDAPNTGGGDGSNPVLPTINISPFGGQFLEGDVLNTQVTFTVSLSEPSSNQVSVDYQTLSFAALSEDVALELYGSTAEADFIGANGTMIFAPGVTQQTFSIEILGDTRVEENESFAVAFSNTQGALLHESIALDDAASSGTVTYIIENDDGPPLFFLTDAERANANFLTFENYVPPPDLSLITWDYQASFSTSADFASLDDIFAFNAISGATYDIFSNSFFDPFILQLYDQSGNLLALDSGEGSYGTDWIQDYVATYSGIHYIDASWHQGSAQSNKYASVQVYEDIDTVGFSKTGLAQATNDDFG